MRRLGGSLAITAMVTMALLVVCNGVLIWLWRAVSPGVAVTLGVAIVGGTLAWLRSRRNAQLTVVVVLLQILIAVSLAAGLWVWSATAGRVAHGVGAAAIVFVALATVTGAGVWYWFGSRSRGRLMRAAAVTVAVVLSSCGGCAYGAWEFTSGFGTAAVRNPVDAVYGWMAATFDVVCQALGLVESVLVGFQVFGWWVGQRV